MWNQQGSNPGSRADWRDSRSLYQCATPSLNNSLFKWLPVWTYDLNISVSNPWWITIITSVIHDWRITEGMLENGSAGTFSQARHEAVSASEFTIVAWPLTFKTTALSSQSARYIRPIFVEWPLISDLFDEKTSTTKQPLEWAYWSNKNWVSVSCGLLDSATETDI